MLRQPEDQPCPLVAHSLLTSLDATGVADQGKIYKDISPPDHRNGNRLDAATGMDRGTSPE